MPDRDNRLRAREERLARTQPPASLSRDEFLAWRAPREVNTGPQRLDNPTWHWLVRTGLSAGCANERFQGPSSRDVGPVWCFDRMGMSQTVLPDGRVVHIAGEHEDYYDEDFYIYNDVIVIEPDGNIGIYGYPRTAFPPTDFHSATLVGKAIVIIGCLGYPRDRVAGTTPVYRLCLDTWRIEPMATDGDAPGWLYEHVAELSEDGQTITLRGGTTWLGAQRSMMENIDSWSLDIATGHWTRLTQLAWQRWTMRRVDRKDTRLSNVRFALWARDHSPHPGKPDFWTFDDAPNFAALARLYRIDDEAPAPVESENFDEHNVIIDGLTVRFTEGGYRIAAMVKGSLTAERLALLQARTLQALAEIDGAEWEIEAEQ